MTPVAATPAHLLLNRKDERDDHSTRPTQRGAASAFSSYGFGPLSEKGSTDKAAQGAPVTGNPLGASSLSWVTQVQQKA
ncbi:MAG: hypothetical protein HY985_14245 [Magnetospirillum sp.]|nr:hypothetical protein [Magnetospirillum sp.]